MKNNITQNKNNTNNHVFDKAFLAGLSNINLKFKDFIYDEKKNLILGLDHFKFIMSIQLSTLLNSELKENNNLIYSTVSGIKGLNYDEIVQVLNNKTYSSDIYIIEVSWLKTMFLDEIDVIEVKEFKYINLFNNEKTIFVYQMSYVKFFNNLNKLHEYRTQEEKDRNLLGINPIIIFSGLHLGNIIHLFKLNNINLHGGTISRRHKLSLVEYRLAVFLDKIDWFVGNKSEFMNVYRDNLYSSSRYEIKDQSKEGSFIYQYKLINIYYSLKLQKVIFEKEILNKNLVINENINKINKLDSNQTNTMESINSLNKKISSLKNKFVENMSAKHKASLTGRIKSIRSEIEDITSQIETDKWEKLNLSNNLEVELKKLKTLDSNINSLITQISEIENKIVTMGNDILDTQFKVDDKYRGKINHTLGGHREYHSCCVGRGYSTDNSIKKFNFEINSPIFIELQRILNNSPLDLKTQMKIEQFLQNQGKILYQQRLDQNLDINYNKINPSILEDLKKSIFEIENLLDNYRINLISITSKDKSAKVESTLITCLTNEIIISQLLGRLLRIISNHNLLNKNTNCTELACDLGRSLLNSYYFQEYKKSEFTNLGLNLFIKSSFSDFEELVSDSILIQLGLKLLNFLEEVGLIHTEIYVKSIDHKNHIYVANPNIIDKIGDTLNLLDITYKIPMIVPPKAYGRDLNTGNDILGGYLLNDQEFVVPLIIKNSELKEQSKILDNNIIFDTVNNLSSVGYKINVPVLDFILAKGLEYDLYTDPKFKHPLEIKKENKKLTMAENRILDEFLSIKQLEMNILGLGLVFKNVPEFFIPVRLDNRGRIYCLVDYLNYQGVELAKSLLLFSKGEKINKFDKKSIEYLKIFGANCYGQGVGKKSFNDRVEWVTKNENDILNFKNGKLIKEAESKLLFIAFCFEYQNYYNSLSTNETFYISNFPIQLDATCNGYQHLSLLTGDEPLAGELNLISGDENTIPKDFYTFVALKINDYLKQRLSEEKQNLLNLEKKEFHLEKEKLEQEKIVNIIDSCERLIKLNKNRTLVKLPIMVKPYNASFFRMVEYVKEKLDVLTLDRTIEGDLIENNDMKFKNKIYFGEKSNPNIKLTNFDLNLFISTMEKVIYNEFPKLKEFNSYLERVANICSILNITITWVLPTGLNVNQYYVDTQAIRLKPFTYRKHRFSLKIKKNNVNKSKQIRALMPNLIHSLDAASLSLILDMFYQEHKNEFNKINFFAIHDCFAVTANNIVNLIKIIKLVYIKIYSDDSYLKRFDEGIINSIKLQFGKDSFNDVTKKIKVNGSTFDYPDVDVVTKGKIKASKIMKAHSIII